MAGQSTLKRERIIEAVRKGLRGEAIIDFVHESGYALSETGFERHLTKMGGLGQLKTYFDSGLSNLEILSTCFPELGLEDLEKIVSSVTPLHSIAPALRRGAAHAEPPEFATTKLTITVPSELYEAIRAAAQAEVTSQNQLIVDLLTTALSRKPEPAASGDPED